MPAPLGHPNYDTEHKAGRPVKYTTEFIEAEATALEEWMGAKKENIFIEDFCIERGYSSSRLNEWESNERFSGAYDMFKMRQKVALFKGGLTKKFSHPMCALILSHAHGVVAKSEQKISGDGSLAFIMQMADGKSKSLVPGDE